MAKDDNHLDSSLSQQLKAMLGNTGIAAKMPMSAITVHD